MRVWKLESVDILWVESWPFGRRLRNQGLFVCLFVFLLFHFSHIFQLNNFCYGCGFFWLYIIRLLLILVCILPSFEISRQVSRWIRSPGPSRAGKMETLAPCRLFLWLVIFIVLIFRGHLFRVARVFACRYLCPAGSCLRLVAGMFPSRDIGFVWPGRFIRAVHIDTRLFDHPGLHRAWFGACELRASFDSRRLGKDLETGDPRRSQTHLLFRGPAAAATAAGGAPRPCVPKHDCMACFCGKRGRPVDQVRVHINKRVYFPIQRRPFLIMCMEIHCDIAQKKFESN